MSGSHDKLPKLFWIQIVLVIIVGTMYLLAPKAEKHTTEASETNHEVQSAAKNLEPVGTVTAKSDEATSGSGAARSGETIYNETCQTCHAAGIANAPKLDDKAAWEPRVANGLDGLLKTAIDGKGAMPPKGGNMSLSDEEMKAVVLYMAGKAGFDLAASDKPASEAPPKEKEVEAPTAAEPTVAVEPEAPKTVEVPAAPVAPPAPAAPNGATVAAVATQPPASVEPPPATTADNSADGEKIYKSACFACHDAGVAGSPKIGDTEAWVARIATGIDAMYNSAINGKGVMPPKGGNMNLSDAEIKAAVDYIAAKSQ